MPRPEIGGRRWPQCWLGTALGERHYQEPETNGRGRARAVATNLSSQSNEASQRKSVGSFIQAILREQEQTLSFREKIRSCDRAGLVFGSEGDGGDMEKSGENRAAMQLSPTALVTLTVTLSLSSFVSPAIIRKGEAHLVQVAPKCHDGDYILPSR